MNKKDSESIKKRYENAVHEYCHAFCEKHGYHYDPNEWVCDGIGTTVLIGDYYISFDDIRYDIDNNVPEDVFIKYYDYTLQISSLDDGTGKMKNVNYPHFIKGLRPYSDEQLKKIEDAKKAVKDAEEALRKCVEEDTCSPVCGCCKDSDVQADGNYCRCRNDHRFHKCNDIACKDYKEGGEE